MAYAVPVSKTTIHFDMQQVARGMQKETQQNPEDVILSASSISKGDFSNLEKHESKEEKIRNLDEDSISF